MMVIITFMNSYNLFAIISNSITVLFMIIIKLQVMKLLFHDILMLCSFYSDHSEYLLT